MATGEAFQLQPIGYVRSSIRQTSEMPRFGVPAQIEILEDYIDGLLHVGKHSHLWILAWLTEARRDTLQVVPRFLEKDKPENLHGVFSVRSPTRPNPIGLTVTRLLGLEIPFLKLERLDFVNGTPVIDIKPYFPTHDLIFTARNVPIGRLPDRAALRESLLVQTLNFCGQLSCDAALAIRIVEHFRAHVLGMSEPAQWFVVVPKRRIQLIDAMMGMTRVSLGQQNLKLRRRNTVTFHHHGFSFDYELLIGSEEDPDAVLLARDQELFRFEAYGPR